MDEIARHYLETYARGGEVDGGWLHAKALQQARLDYSDASLDRLDALMAAIRERAQPSRAALVDSPQGRNFCQLIGFYLIEMVVRRTGAHIGWHDLDTAEKLLPPGPKLPRGSISRLVAWAPDQERVFLPLACTGPPRRAACPRNEDSENVRVYSSLVRPAFISARASISSWLLSSCFLRSFA